MSDTFQYPEDDGQAFDPVSFIQRQRQRQVGSALTSLDANPDDAARAIELSKATGAPPALIHGDLENFEREQKAALTSELVKSNQFLAQYADSHPLAPIVSNDDWGQLDAISKLAQPFGRSRLGQIISAPQTSMGAAVKGFQQGFGQQPMGQWLSTDAGLNRMAWAEMTALGYPIELASRVFSGAVEGAKQGIKQAQLALGVDDNTAERNANEAAAIFEAEAGGLTGRHHVGEPAEAAVNKAFQESVVKQAGEVGRVIKPFVDAGVEPPVGLHPIIDKLHSDQTKQDLKNLDELFSEAQKSSTKERSPELFKNFIDQHTDSKIGIDAEAIRKLYGAEEGKPVEFETDDNKLGWVPGIQDQMQLAELHGGDVQVPLADWLAKVDPEIAKELHDNIRVRPNGMTLEETKAPEGAGAKPAEEPKEGEEPLPPPTPVDAIRQGAGIQIDLRPEGEREPAVRGIIPEETQPDKWLGSQRFPVSEGLKLVDKDQLPRGVSRELARFFEDRLNKVVGDTPVIVLEKPDLQELARKAGLQPGTVALYNGKQHVIAIERNFAEGNYGHKEAARLLYHEMWHAFTYRALETQPELKGLVRQMMDETAAYHGDDLSKYAYQMQDEHEFLSGVGSEPEFQKLMRATPVSKELGAKLNLGAKAATVWDAVREIISRFAQKLTGFKPPPNMLDAVLSLGPMFEESTKELVPGRGGAGAIAKDDIEGRIQGLMPKGLRQQYLEKIAKQQTEDAEFQRAQALKRSAETQTKEWRANEGEMQDKVREELKQRPDIAADAFLRKADIDPKKLSSEEADILAGRFGYTSGDQMLGALQRLGQERDLEALTPASHLTKIVNVETERRMRKEYGTLDEQILKEAEDHVVSPTQIDLLHDKMLALGMAAKVNEPLASKENMRLAVREFFGKSIEGPDAVAKYLAAAGRAGNAIRDAFLDDDIVGAFKAQQEQIYSMMLADEAKKFEKETKRGEKLIKKYSVRAPTGVDPEFANYAQEILNRIGKGGRILEDIQRQRGFISNHADLASFVAHVNDKGTIWSDPDAMPVGQQMPVASFLLAPEFRKKLEDMTVDERKAVFDSLKTIDKNAREANKYNVKGNKEDLEKVLEGLIERLKAAVDNKKLNQGPQQANDVRRLFGALILNPETWFNRLDLGNRRGPFNQLVMRPIIEGQYTLKTLEREFAKEYRDIGDFPDAKKKIDNPLFRDTDGTLLQLNRGNLYAIIANMGNALQRKKLAAGHGIDNPDKIFQWLFNVTTKEDWDRAGKMGAFFSKVFDQSEKMYAELSGVTPERIQLGTIQTPWGEMPEWYHPLIPNPLKRNPALKAGDMMDESGYYRPATATGYTKKRTGAVYPIDLSFDSIPSRVKIMLNDIAMHPAISEVTKILLNKKFHDTFTQYYGKEYAKALEPWLKDAAGQQRYTPGTDAALERVVNAARENMSTLLIGFNMGTVMKHAPTALAFSMKEVGPLRFVDSMFHILHETEEGVTRWRFAMDNSEELQNRLRSTRESISASNQDLFKRYDWDHKVFTMRDLIQTIGAMPVAGSDFASAVPMWDAAYRKEMEKPGTTHGDAVYLANTAVRRTHGSSIITNRPAAMRMNPWVQTFMPFYNFFNNAAQRLYESGWQAKLSLSGRSLPEMTGFEKEQFNKGAAAMKLALGGFLTYGVIVSMVEQVVDPLPAYDPHDKLGGAKYWAKVIARGPASTIPFLRDLVNAALGGHEPSAGLLGTLYQDVARPLTGKEPFADPGRAIKNTNNAIGALTGMTYGAAGNVGKYIWDLEHGKERPRSAYEAAVGLRYGTTKDHAKSFDEYLKHLIGHK